MDLMNDMLLNDAKKILIPNINAEQMLNRIKAMNIQTKKKHINTNLIPALTLSFVAIIAITTPIVYFNINQNTYIRIGFDNSTDESIPFNWVVALESTKKIESSKNIEVFYGHKSYKYLFDNLNLQYDSSSTLDLSIIRIISDKNKTNKSINKTIFSNKVNFNDVFLNDYYLANYNNEYEFNNFIFDNINIEDINSITEGYIYYRVIVTKSDDISFTGIYQENDGDLEKIVSYGNSEALSFNIKDKNKIELNKII